MHAPTCQQNVLKLATEAIDFLARFECKRKIRIQYVGVKYSTHDVCDVTFSSTCSLLFWRCDMDKTNVGYNDEILFETWEKHRDNKHFHTNNAYRPMLHDVTWGATTSFCSRAIRPTYAFHMMDLFMSHDHNKNRPTKFLLTFPPLTPSHGLFSASTLSFCVAYSYFPLSRLL